MATSTFSKQFVVRPEKATEFINEMSRAVTSTLQKGFQSNSVHLSQDEELREKLSRVLNN